VGEASEITERIGPGSRTRVQEEAREGVDRVEVSLAEENQSARDALRRNGGQSLQY
jgi:hypothetical protein